MWEKCDEVSTPHTFITAEYTQTLCNKISLRSNALNMEVYGSIVLLIAQYGSTLIAAIEKIFITSVESLIITNA